MDKVQIQIKQRQEDGTFKSKNMSVLDQGNYNVVFARIDHLFDELKRNAGKRSVKLKFMLRD